MSEQLPEPPVRGATDRGWFDEPRNGRKVFWGVCVVCALLLVPDLLPGVYPKHGHYSWENWFGLHGFYGFVACFVLVLAAKELRRLLMRDEDYYDD